MKSSLASLLVLVGLTACGGPPVAQVSPSPQASASPAQQLGPGGLTLDEEIGAVMMVGFVGPVTNSVLADWTWTQYGGRLIGNLNPNGTPAYGVSRPRPQPP